MSDTLYGGDRAGSRYYFVLENTQATESAQKDSGLLNPGFTNRVTALQLNPFVKYRGLEFFGILEHADGGAASEAVDRASIKQQRGDELRLAGAAVADDGNVSDIGSLVDLHMSDPSADCC
jgi:hypothetical protein